VSRGSASYKHLPLGIGIGIGTHGATQPSCGVSIYPWVFNTCFFDRPEIVDFGGLGGPGRPGNLPKGWGAKPPTFLEGFQAARGRPDPKNLRFPVTIIY